ncbi:hypothetical protein EDB85DRAFT_1986667 [Lactarius pseudohatsudake]|nr:hypothetical protein EDB85DRAFT_1986667 [Lactarius pseudohatsudake]
MVASNITKFFKAFPDLEEDAINAMLSFECLRSSLDGIDEPEEVAVIKMILIQHLELDSKVTLGVLCDQIVPPDDPMEDEDKTIRERLEALVVAFLAQDTRKPLLAQLQGQRRVLPSKKVR